MAMFQPPPLRSEVSEPPPPPEAILLPETTWELRAPLYADVEELIFPGFLSHHVRVKGAQLVFRSLAQGDLTLLRARTHGLDDYGWKLWLVASSLWMMNGVCLLDQPQRAPWFRKFLGQIPRTALDVLSGVVLGLFNRQNNAIEAVEAYCYEDRTRHLWRMFHSQHPSKHTGIPGIKHVGSNFIQRMWISFNQIEDERLQEKNQWEGFKMVASTMAHKWIQQVNTKERESWDKELRRRRAACDLWYYRSIGLLAKEEPSKKTHRGRYQDSKSPTDLSEEMRMWVEGEQDVHDKVVQDYKDKITAVREAQKQAQRDYSQMIRETTEANFDHLPTRTNIVGYTPDQLHQIISQRPGGAGAAGVRFIPMGESEHQEDVYERWVGRGATPGPLKVDAQGKIHAPGQVQLDGADVVFVKEGADVTFVPKPGDAPSLNDQIQGRRVQFHSDSD